MAQIIHNDLGRTKNFVAATVATLSNFEDDLIGLAAVMPHGNGLMPVGIEGPPNVLDNRDAVVLEQLAHLLQRHCHTLTQLLEGTGLPGRQSTFEIVENGQQVGNESFFLRSGLLLGIAPGALFEVVKVSGEAEIIVLLNCQFLLEDGGVSRRHINYRAGKFGIAGWHLGTLGTLAFFLL